VKILLLTKKVPFPLTDGEVIAIHSLSKGLVAQGCELHLLALNTQKHFVAFDKTPTELSHFTSIEIINIDTRIKLMPALVCLLLGKSYNIDRFISQEFDNKLRLRLEKEQFDIIQLETLYMVPYADTIRKSSSAIISLRSHNVESEIWKNLSSESSGLKGWYLGHCARMLSRFEKTSQSKYDLLLPITQIDADHFADRGDQARVKVVSVGIDMSKYAPGDLPVTLRKIGFLGSLDWQPNLEGIDWFLNEVWPIIVKTNPHLEFHIGGRNMPPKFLNLKAPGVTIHRKVENARAYVNDMDMIVVPLFSGSGIRVKILEAMSLGKVVLSTPKGFEGIGIKNLENGIVFKNKTDLIEIIDQINSLNISKIGGAARRHIQNNFSAKSIAKDLLNFYQTQKNEK
jgi:glycosyltransferase involved in cell wall biosynthesis